jgi:hypothetical protein
MAKHDENGAVQDGGGSPTHEALEQRIRELEDENRQLRSRMAQMESDWDLDRQSLEWYYSLGLPQSEAEMLEQVRTGPSISDVLAECERVFGK